MKETAVFCQGTSTVERGNFVVERGNLVVECGNLVVECGNSVVERGNLTVEGGNSVVERGNLVVEGGNLVEVWRGRSRPAKQSGDHAVIAEDGRYMIFFPRQGERRGSSQNQCGVLPAKNHVSRTAGYKEIHHEQ